MEGLVLLLGEFLFSLFGAVALLLAEIVFFLFSTIAQVACSLIGRASAGEQKSGPKHAVRLKRFAPKVKVAFRVFGGLAVIFVILLILFNTVWFEPSFRWIAQKVAHKTGMELSFSTVEGSYFSGQIELGSLSVSKEGDDQLNYRLSVENLLVEIDPLQLLSRPVRLNRLEINGLDGSVHRCRQAPRPRNSSDADMQMKLNLKPRRSFKIDSMSITDGRVRVVEQVVNEAPLEFEIVLNALESKPFRGGYAVFDLLFRSNASGMIADCPFTLSASIIEGGRSTEWNVEALPVLILRHFIGGPFKSVTHGTVDIDVVDYWRLGRSSDIDMKWALIFRDVHAVVPEGLSKFEGAVAGAAVGYINEHGKEFPLSFELTMNQEKFKGAASLRATGLFSAVSKSFLKEIAGRLDMDENGLKENISDGFNAFKGFLNSKRKEPAADAEPKGENESI